MKKVARLISFVTVSMVLMLGVFVTSANAAEECDSCSILSVYDHVTAGIRRVAKEARFVDFSVRCSDEPSHQAGAKVLRVIVVYDFAGKTQAARFNAEYLSTGGTVSWLYPLDRDWKKIHDGAAPAEVK